MQQNFNLLDSHAPETIAWYSFSPYLISLLSLLLLALIALIVWFYLVKKSKKYLLFNKIWQEYHLLEKYLDSESNHHKLAGQINILLKRIYLSIDKKKQNNTVKEAKDVNQQFKQFLASKIKQNINWDIETNLTAKNIKNFDKNGTKSKTQFSYTEFCQTLSTASFNPKQKFPGRLYLQKLKIIIKELEKRC